MAGVPYIFGNATTSIPLTNLDANFNTGLTIGNTTVGLGNTVTTLGNVTLNNANFGAVANAVIYTNSSGNVTSNASVFSVNGTSVGIGTTSPANKLHVTSSTAVPLLITGYSVAGNAATYNGSLLLGDTSGYQGQISYDATSASYLSLNNTDGAGTIRFSTGNTERLRVTSGGNLQFQTSNTGIVFNNSSALTNSVLNDYETGTWTPAATNLTINSGSATWSGIYTKIGNIVTVTFQLTGGNFTITSNSTYVNNMPFVSNYNGAGAFVLGSTTDGGFMQPSSSSRCYFAATKTSTSFFCTVTYTATF